jgi:hypothetical protein
MGRLWILNTFYQSKHSLTNPLFPLLPYIFVLFMHAKHQTPNFLIKSSTTPISPLISPKESLWHGNLQCQVKSRNILVNKGLGPLKTPLKTETQVMIKHSFFQ